MCAFGCPTGAKQHVGEVYLPRAVAAGATILTGVHAERILLRGRRAVGVAARAEARGLARPPTASRCARRA